MSPFMNAQIKMLSCRLTKDKVLAERILLLVISGLDGFRLENALEK